MKTAIGSICLVFAVCLPSIAQETLFDVDFAKDCKQGARQIKGSFSGPLPDACRDDFAHWNDSVVESSIQDDGGRKFLRFETKELDKAAQFKIQSGDIPPGCYKLIIEARTPRGLNVCIRQSAPPHVVFWSEALTPSTGWMTYSFYLRVEPEIEFDKWPSEKRKTSASGLRLLLKFPKGTTELASMKLLKATGAEIAVAEEQFKRTGEAKAAAEQASLEAWHATLTRAPENSPNFIRNSRFPLGLPSGWSVQRASAPGEFSVATDLSELGPSGCHPLLIDGTALRSEPFNTPFFNTGRKCVLSFFYKAKKSFGVSIIAANFIQRTFGTMERTLAERTMPASDVWTRGELEFTEPDGKTKCLSVGFADGNVVASGNDIHPRHGEIKLDAFQVYYGSPGRPYQSAGDCEVALAPASSEMEAERVQFSDEPARFKYCATGILKDAILKIKVYNVHGQGNALPDIPLSAKPSGEIDYAVFPEMPLGQFRIEVWAEREGKCISPFNELVMTRVRRPLHWGKDAPDSPFGIHCLPQKALSMKAAGMNWLRDSSRLTAWVDLEPEKGKWNFNDKAVDCYRKAHIKIAGMLHTTPEWAACSKGVKDNSFAKFCQPKDLADYANYVRSTVGHFKGVIDEYMIWNEPTWGGWGNDSRFWFKTYDPNTNSNGKNPNSVQEFIELSKVAYASAKEVYPEVRIVGINAGLQPWMNQLLKGGAYGYCDMADFHFYPEQSTLSVFGYPGDSLEKVTAEARRIAKEQGKRLINSESNGATIDFNVTREDGQSALDDGTGIYRHSIVWKSPFAPLEIANATPSFVMKNLALGVTQVFLYSAYCYEFLPRTPTYATLLGADGFPSPTYAAFSNMAWLLEDRKFAQCIQIGDGVWAYVFEGRGSSVAVISGLKNGSYSIPESKDIEGVDLFGNPLPKGAKYEGRLLYLQSALPADKLAVLLKLGAASQD